MSSILQTGWHEPDSAPYGTQFHVRILYAIATDVTILPALYSELGFHLVWEK